MNLLEEARQEIDRIDSQMRALFEERMTAVGKVAQYKKERGMQIFDSARENQVIEKNAAKMTRPDLRPYYVSFLRAGMDVSKQYQHRLLEGLRVAFSGVEGAFAQIAARRIFPDGASVPHPSFRAAYDAVVSGECDLAVLPLENSSNGDVGQVMDLIFFGDLYVSGIYDIAVVQNLLGVKGATVDGVKTVISHPQALGQCAAFLRAHGYATQERVNTAVAAKEVAETGDPTLAAIASEEAAAEFGLVKLEGHINEDATNTTRFVVLSRDRRDPSEGDRNFILLFTVKNEAGCLAAALAAIGESGFNMRALKSRPSRELAWSYYFFCECEGNIHSENGKALLEKLKETCFDVKVAGSYEKDIQL